MNQYSPVVTVVSLDYYSKLQSMPRRLTNVFGTDVIKLLNDMIASPSAIEFVGWIDEVNACVYVH